MRKLPEFLIPSPLQKVELPLFKEKGISFYVKRDDLIHNQLNGNKYRKLKYNIKHLQANDYKGIITFGGAFSNHILASAAAANLFGFQSVGIIRGNELNPDSNTVLRKAKSLGMTLYFVSRSEYRLKDKSSEISSIIEKHSDLILIPEGGTNEFALEGAGEIVDELIIQDFVPNIILLPCGTGGTTAGLIKRVKELNLNICIQAFSSLKGGFLADDISQLLGFVPKATLFQLISDYHFGGYAKSTEELSTVVNSFSQYTHIPVDTVYNAKLIYGLLDKVKQDSSYSNKTIIWINTGGYS